MTRAQQQQQQRRALPQFGTSDYWAAAPETQELIEACVRLEAAVSAFDALEFRHRGERSTDREPTLRWAQLMTGHLYELGQEARLRAFAALDEERAERAAQERAPEGTNEDDDEGGEA